MEKNAKVQESKRSNFATRLDGIGFTASSLCAVHCALMPFVITFLPVLGLEFLAEPWLEISITIFSIVIGVSSLIPSYRKYHHNKIPLMLLVAGFVMIFGAHFLGFHHLEPILVPIGGISLAAAHYMNWKLSKAFHCHDRNCTVHH